MLKDQWKLKIYFDVGYKTYIYNDYLSLVEDMKGDLYYLIHMCKEFKIIRSLVNDEE